MEIRLRVPKVPAGLFANLLGLAGLVAVAWAIGALVGNWRWSVLVGGVFAVILAGLAGLREEAGEAKTRQLSSVKPVTAKTA